MTNLTPTQLESLRYRGFLRTPEIGQIAAYQSIEPRSFSIPENPNIPEDAPPLPEKLVFGKRMERYFRYQIESTERYLPIGENIQVIADGVTLGEIDFILIDSEENQLVHVEMAYKFYLYDSRIATPIERWIGPNRKDSLIEKLEKLLNEQFPIFHRAQTKQILQALALPDMPLVQALNLKAQLYLPYDQRATIPEDIAVGAIAGYWMQLEQFDAMAEGVLFLPPKENWSIHPRHWNEWVSIVEAREQIEFYLSKKKSPLCWMKTDSGGFMRFFVVWWPQEFDK